jgi:hypothetical protein
MSFASVANGMTHLEEAPEQFPIYFRILHASRDHTGG